MNNLRDFFSERLVFGSMAFIGYLTLSTLILIGVAHDKGVSDTMQGVILGALGTAVAQVISATFRTDKIDQQRAATADTAVSALAAATPSAPTPSSSPAPVEVTGPGGGPVRTEEATT